MLPTKYKKPKKQGHDVFISPIEWHNFWLEYFQPPDTPLDQMSNEELRQWLDLQCDEFYYNMTEAFCEYLNVRFFPNEISYHTPLPDIRARMEWEMTMAYSSQAVVLRTLRKILVDPILINAIDNTIAKMQDKETIRQILSHVISTTSPCGQPADKT